MSFVHSFSLFVVFLALVQCQRFMTTEEPWIWYDDPPGTQKPSTSTSTIRPTQSTTTNAPSIPAPRVCPGCPLTPQYQPVCGSDMATYDNPAAVECANMCGPRIEILFYAACQRTIGLVLPSTTTP